MSPSKLHFDSRSRTVAITQLSPVFIFFPRFTTWSGFLSLLPYKFPHFRLFHPWLRLLPTSTLPFEIILRRVSVGQERDVLFNKDELLKFADTVWRGSQGPTQGSASS